MGGNAEAVPLTRGVRDEDVPAYARVKANLRDAIHRNDYAPGERLPSQHDLGATHGVSRITIVRALQDLEYEGLVERRQGVGTFVATRGHPLTLTNASLLYKQTFEVGQTPVHRLVSIDEADAYPDDVEPAVRGPLPVWRVVRCRIRDGVPVSFEEALIPAAYVPDGVSPRALENMLLHDFLTHLCGRLLAFTRVFIAAKQVSVEEATTLGGLPGDAGLLITRVAYGPGDRPISVSRNTLPAHASSYYFEFRHDATHPGAPGTLSLEP